MKSVIPQLVSSLDSASRIVLKEILWDGRAVSFRFETSKGAAANDDADPVAAWLEQHGEEPSS